MRTLMIATLLLAATATFAQEQDPDQEPYAETIFVIRYALDVRVTDSWGRAIEDLGADDFIVRIGGKPAHVETATWIAEGRNAKSSKPAETIDEEDEADLPSNEPPSDEPDERSIVVFMQTDFSRVNGRVLGQMKFNYLVPKILRMLGPHDRVAVVSHDSHLKFRRDFTYDRESVRKGIRESLFLDEPAPPAPSTTGATLSYVLDPTAMKKAADAESALLVIANALHGIGGPKMIILAGWGIGELQGKAGVQLKPQWNEAVGILHHDHVPVIALDTGLRAQLMAGLKATASATGGLYADTVDWDDQALVRVEGALAGHYSLTLRLDDLLKSGQHPLDVRVTRKGLEVQAPSFVVHR